MSSRSLEIEQALVGTVLLDSKQIEKVRSIAQPEDFDNSVLADIYRAVLVKAEAGATIDPVALASEMGVEFAIAAACMERVQVTKNAPEYAVQVKAESVKRNVDTLIADLTERRASEESISDIMSVIKSFADGYKPVGSKMSKSSKDAMFDFIMWRRELDKIGPQLVATGYQGLDDTLGGGMVNGGLYIIASRPGMGKTTAAAAIADNIAARGKKVLFISLEMSVTQMSARRIARATNINYGVLMNGTLTKEDYSKVTQVANMLAKRPLHLLEARDLKVSDIEREINAVKPDIVVVDYLGLMSPVTKKKSRYEEVTDLSKALKTLAMAHEIPLLVLAQLNRENTKGTDKRPNMAHLRDSGAIEQDADGIILLHRNEYYEGDAQGTEEIEFIVAKNRHGRTGTVVMHWFGGTGAIKE